MCDFRLWIPGHQVEADWCFARSSMNQEESSTKRGSGAKRGSRRARRAQSRYQDQSSGHRSILLPHLSELCEQDSHLICERSETTFALSLRALREPLLLKSLPKRSLQIYMGSRCHTSPSSRTVGGERASAPDSGWQDDVRRRSRVGDSR